SMDYAGDGNLSGWGNNKNGGLLAGGGKGPFGSTGSGTGPGVGPGFGGHSRASVDASPPPSLMTQSSLSLDEILRVIRSNLNQIRHCYEQALQRKPNLSGRIKVAFT